MTGVLQTQRGANNYPRPLFEMPGAAALFTHSLWSPTSTTNHQQADLISAQLIEYSSLASKQMQARAENFLQGQQWSFEQPMLQENGFDTHAQVHKASPVPPPAPDFHRAAPLPSVDDVDGPMEWPGKWQTDPLSVATQEQGPFQNGNPHFNSDMVSQAFVRNGGLEYASGPQWVPPDTTGLPHPPSLMSDQDTDLSSSPRTMWSETSKPDRLLTCNTAKAETSPSIAGVDAMASPYPRFPQSPSNDTSLAMYELDPELIQHGGGAGMNLHQSEFHVFESSVFPSAPTPSCGLQVMGFTGAMSSDMQSSPWMTPIPQYIRTSTYTGNPALLNTGVGSPSSLAMASFDLNERHVASYEYGQDDSLITNPDIGEDEAQRNSDSPARQMTGDNSTVQTSSTLPSTSRQRKFEDDILLEGKRAGLTYKEIRKKMKTKVAESTLRGRYRSLTKARRDRVRKPVWTDEDVRLLKEIVCSELDRIDSTGHYPPADSQTLTKVSWKKVAEFIAENGGSYHFGNSTCKKKWTEICVNC
ncbi:hypothetical protein CC78DRAFT_610973 [Lojkania enalia]|uniref:Myb-like domain-containing protein n=1 Tax=Lojkania enalia TaxID=147567 RepID=A0A9P4TRZ0_9PLEO|nr:hypothetical protein CC78DRAFT_610973 [Didymosphaeria enalia]